MISVIIPTYKRECIFDCVKSIIAQKDAPEYEILVVARDIDYDTAFGLSRLNVRVIHYNEPGNGPAKNFAISFAKGDFLVFTDDDCIVSKYWLAELYKNQVEHNADIVVGQCYPHNNLNPYLVAHQAAIMYHMDSKNPIKVTVGTTMNLMIRKSIFLALKGFDNTFSIHMGDDYDFNQRWANNLSIHAVYAPNAFIWHDHRLTFKKLMKLSFRYGMGSYHCAQLSLKRGVQITAHTPRKEYLSMVKYVYSTSNLYTLRNTRIFAAALMVLAHEVKHFGSMYARLSPTAPSKVY